MTQSRADVAERRPHRAGIVLTLRAGKEMGRQTYRQAAFVRSLTMFGLFLAKSRIPLHSAVT